MKIGLGADHAGFEYKEELVKYLNEKGYEVVDYGATSLDRVDYPDYAQVVGKAVINKDIDYGILVCGTGIGMSIAANKVEGIRAALVYNELTAKLAKEHNHAQIIAVGGRTHTLNETKLIVDTFLKAHEEPRHNQRVEKIQKIEESK